MKLIKMIPLALVAVPLDQLPHEPQFSYVVSQGFLKVYKQIKK